MHDCRRAIDAALEHILAPAPQAVVVVGAGTRTRRYESGVRGSLAPVGVDVRVHLGGDAATDSAPLLPVSLTLGAWMLERAGWSGRTSALEVATDEDPQVCRALGEALADDPSRLALMVVADGTARRGAKAPGYTDERAAGFDEGWVRAVAAADAAGLAAIHPHQAEDLMMAGRAPLHVLAAAAGTTPASSELLYSDDPYGVQYVVATWRYPRG